MDIADDFGYIKPILNTSITAGTYLFGSKPSVVPLNYVSDTWVAMTYNVPLVYLLAILVSKTCELPYCIGGHFCPAFFLVSIVPYNLIATIGIYN